MIVDQAQQQRILGDALDAFRAIGYRAGWLRQRYAFADLYAPGTPARTIDLGVFGQDPPDYRSACFGLQFADQIDTAQGALNRVRAFGAPQIFYIANGVTERWRIHANGASLAERLPTADLGARIEAGKADWNPQSVLRAKAGFEYPGPRQQDFVDIGLLPALEHEAARKIDNLVRRTCAIAESYYKQRHASFDAATVFALIFQLLIGKLLHDRGMKTVPAIDFAKPETVLAAVRNHYPSQDQQALKRANLLSAVLAALTSEIGSSFSFANLSVETLTYVYENTFVSVDSRKKLGIHSTPSYLADYVLSQMPIEDLPRRDWNVLDPTCGHGIFLIAAMRRIRPLLPPDWSGRQRHEFFASHMQGTDLEKFSIEVARMCLMLADFPEANGWGLINKDIFSGHLLEDVSEKATIVVGNPPFEAFSDRNPQVRKPAELLRRMLPALPQGAMLGLVLPRAFLDGDDYRSQRRVLLDQFELLSITGLPDRIFAHSDAETTILVARKTSQARKRVLFRQVLDKDRESFRESLKVTWEDSVSQEYFKTDRTKRLIVPALRELWEFVCENQIVSDVATILTGMRYKDEGNYPNRGQVFYDRPGANRCLGIREVTDAFMQYHGCEEIYFSMAPSVQQNNSWQHEWSKEKVVVPASRNSRGPWRYAAMLDLKGRCVSRRFHAVWPKSDSVVNAHVLTAVLNAPLAMAYVFSHSFQHDVPIRVYESIPLPRLSALVEASDLMTQMIDRYIAEVSKRSFDEEKARAMLLKIDATVLGLYNLPPRLERKLLDIFWGANRRVPFSFNGYIPPEYMPWVSLLTYISPSLVQASARSVLERLPIVKDLDALRDLESMNSE